MWMVGSQFSKMHFTSRPTWRWAVTADFIRNPPSWERRLVEKMHGKPRIPAAVWPLRPRRTTSSPLELSPRVPKDPEEVLLHGCSLAVRLTTMVLEKTVSTVGVSPGRVVSTRQWTFFLPSQRFDPRNNRQICDWGPEAKEEMSRWRGYTPDGFSLPTDFGFSLGVSLKDTRLKRYQEPKSCWIGKLFTSGGAAEAVRTSSKTRPWPTAISHKEIQGLESRRSSPTLGATWHPPHDSCPTIHTSASLTKSFGWEVWIVGRLGRAFRASRTGVDEEVGDFYEIRFLVISFVGGES